MLQQQLLCIVCMISFHSARHFSISLLLSWLYYHILHFRGHLMVSALFRCCFKINIIQWIIMIYTYRNAPKYLHTRIHSQKLSLFFLFISIIFFLPLFQVMFCSSPFHWPPFNCNVNSVWVLCMHTRRWGREWTVTTACVCVSVHDWSIK